MTDQDHISQISPRIVSLFSCGAASVVATKIVYNEVVEEHRAFKPEGVADVFIHETSAKTRAWYCYRPISYFTKSIHKANSFRSFAASQS